jgi:hypothetical protein
MVKWTGEVEEWLTEDGTEIPTLILDNGMRIEIHPDGLAFPYSDFILNWMAIVVMLEKIDEDTIKA